MSDSQGAAPNVKAMRNIKLPELKPESGAGGLLLGEDMQLIQSVKICLSVSVGACELTVRDLFALKEDSLLQLDKRMSEPVDILLEGKLIARGNLVAVDDDFGVKITEIVRPEPRE